MTVHRPEAQHRLRRASSSHHLAELGGARLSWQGCTAMLVALTWGSSLLAVPYAVGALGYLGALMLITVLHVCSTFSALLVMQVWPIGLYSGSS
jgi:hypothetical protein